MKRISVLLVTAFLGGLVALGGAKLLGFDFSNQSRPFPEATNARLVNYNNPADAATPLEGFTVAADRTLPAVVHIRASVKVNNNQSPGFDFRSLPEPFRDFFDNPGFRQGPQDPLREGAGSGVIISADGYIVTNNHVAGDAEDLEVTLNDKRVYSAKLIGADPSTDIALIKIDEKDLPFLTFANSDDVRVGEWVVAVGNPFNLASTVTAGIVSAKGRSINILEGQAPIESFIQTDAAVNPGNSGGALVNTKGELIGINTAIATPTGVYAGYSFAVPGNIAAKVVKDLKEFGVVQRGYLGAIIRGVDGKFAKEKGLSVNEGVYVDSLVDNSAAAAAGLKVGDVITKVDGTPTQSSPELLDQIGRRRPGDKVNLTVLRKGQEKNVLVTLKNKSGNTDVVKKDEKTEVLAALGAELAPLSAKEKEQTGLSGGVKVTRLLPGKLRNQTDIREGFIITKVDRYPVNSVDDLTRALDGRSGGVMLEGVYPGADKVYYYAFGM